ncbi:MAG: hypothetical protein HY234_02030 [Acidobacteria bacterium]|nr:hypothetical protein [Acidobacteriota bacterium]MBI3661818.1 hypothetical protein [Acidobacteriota bacterium]
MRFHQKTCVCAFVASALWIAVPAAAQEKAPPAARQVNVEERRQVSDIVNVTSATQKVQLLTAFLAAHPASVVRARLLTHVGVAITREPDAAVCVTLAEKFLALMSTDQERNVAGAILAEAYLKANRVDDAFQTIAVIRDDEALDLRLLVRLTTAGADEARQRNLEHLAASRKYGDLAIRAMEADRRPAGMDSAMWTEYKGKTLPSLYQSLGMLSLHGGAAAEAQTYLKKAVELAPDDPLNYIFLGAAANEEYMAATQQLKQVPPGAARDELWGRTTMLLDQVIDAYAHAVALSAGSSQEEAIRAQVWPDLENYYKFRHKGSLEGLQALIATYKKQ